MPPGVIPSLRFLIHIRVLLHRVSNLDFWNDAKLNSWEMHDRLVADEDLSIILTDVLTIDL